jgi:hypothetical protein
MNTENRFVETESLPSPTGQVLALREELAAWITLQTVKFNHDESVTYLSLSAASQNQTIYLLPLLRFDPVTYTAQPSHTCS